MRRLKRQRDPIGAEAVKGQITEITRQLRDTRKEVSLCDDILLRSARTREELEWLMDRQDHEQGKEENDNELFRRRGGTGRADEFGRR